MGRKEVDRKYERNIVMTEVVEEDDESFFNIVRTVDIKEDDSTKTKRKFEGRLGQAVNVECRRLDNRVVKCRDKTMEERLGRRRHEGDKGDNLETDDGKDLPDWDERVLIRVDQSQSEIEQNYERRREVIEELNKIEVARQREETRRKEEEFMRKEESIKIEENRRNEIQRIEHELRK